MKSIAQAFAYVVTAGLDGKVAISKLENQKQQRRHFNLPETNYPGLQLVMLQELTPFDETKSSAWYYSNDIMGEYFQDLSQKHDKVCVHATLCVDILAIDPFVCHGYIPDWCTATRLSLPVDRRIYTHF